MSDYSIFKLKNFELMQCDAVFKIGTDAMVLGSWITLNCAPKRILDLGTGTGILSLMMAQKFPSAQILAVDSNPHAVDLSKENFQNNALGKFCSSVCDTFSGFSVESPVDFIVSNPPYFLESKVAENQVNALSKHLDSSSLREFFACISRNLSEEGTAAIVHPDDGHFEKMAAEFDFSVIRQLRVYGAPDKLVRLCNVYARQRSEAKVSDLTIRDASGSYTKEYKVLTSAFHGVQL